MVGGDIPAANVDEDEDRDGEPLELAKII